MIDDDCEWCECRELLVGAGFAVGVGFEVVGAEGAPGGVVVGGWAGWSWLPHGELLQALLLAVLAAAALVGTMPTAQLECAGRHVSSSSEEPADAQPDDEAPDEHEEQQELEPRLGFTGGRHLLPAMPSRALRSHARP